MVLMTLTAAELLVYMTAKCPSKIETLPQQNTTVVYKCITEPLKPKKDAKK